MKYSEWKSERIVSGNSTGHANCGMRAWPTRLARVFRRWGNMSPYNGTLLLSTLLSLSVSLLHTHSTSTHVSLANVSPLQFSARLFASFRFFVFVHVGTFVSSFIDFKQWVHKRIYDEIERMLELYRIHIFSSCDVCNYLVVFMCTQNKYPFMFVDSVINELFMQMFCCRTANMCSLTCNVRNTWCFQLSFISL